MKRVSTLDEIRLEGPSALTVGVFDGVHIGHQAIMRAVKDEAASHGARSAVLTFDRNPLEFMRPEVKFQYITTLDWKMRLIEAQGIDTTIVLEVGSWLVDMAAEDFVLEVLVRRFQAVQVIVGDDFRFGKGRAGDVALLRKMAPACGFEVDSMPPVKVGGVPVSSTAIRGLVSSGQVEKAAEMLGRPFSLSGCVVKGKGLGKGLGFPTANVQAPEEQLVPSAGIYAGSVRLDGKILPAAISVGGSPTLGDESFSIEAHIIGFSEDVYGRELEVEFTRRLRDQAKFPSIDALKLQIARDVEMSRL